MSHPRIAKATAIALAFCVFANFGNAQETESPDPSLQLTPSPVVQKPDAKSLTDKASYLIGFNFMSSAKRQPDADMNEIMKGMKASADGQKMASFLAGYQMMEQLKKSGAEFNLDQIRVGMEKANSNQELGMSDEEVQMLMTAFSKMMEEKQMAKLKKESDDNLAAGEAFIAAEKAKNPNLKQLENGVYYEVLNEGTGPKPTVNNTVRVDYTGSFTDGEVFDSSVKPLDGSPPEPAVLEVGGFIPGFSAALQNMNTGAKWRVMIPGPIAYGNRGQGKIGPNQMLVFELTLLEILK